MANKKISELAAVATLAVEDEVAVVDKDVVATNKATIEQILDLSPSCRDISRGLVIKNNTTNPNYQIDVDADEIILQDASGKTARITNINLTLDITVDLDTGAEAAGTWYYLWATSASSGKLSLSSTAPTISASTKKALVGAVRNDGSSNFIAFYQEDNHVEYNAVQTIKDGGLTFDAWTSLSVTAIFPTTAKRIKVAHGSNSSQIRAISPRSDGHAGSYFKSSASNAAHTLGGVMPTARISWSTVEIRHVDPFYYYVQDGADETLVAIGWEY